MKVSSVIITLIILYYDIYDETFVRSFVRSLRFVHSFIRCRCLLGDGKWMELEFAGGLFGTSLDGLENVIRVNYKQAVEDERRLFRPIR